MESQFGISGSKVLLTGGTGGIGSALVEGFLQAGAHVCMMARDEDAAKLSQQKYSEYGANFSYVIADFLSDSSCLSAVAQASKALGQIDTLVLAHGNVKAGPAVDMTLESWSEQIQVNLTATFRLAQAVAPEMIKRGSGKIIIYASMLTFQGGLNASGYAASKGGVGQLTKALSNEWAPYGVNVNSIAPGYIKTKLNQHIWKDPEREKAVLARLTSGRWGNPEDLVGPTLFLSSHAADYLHGVILPVDGGWLSR
jgi:2-deoxy-D-gluconate 3-dehydrogenase